MARKVNRPFGGLTWAQLLAVRDGARGTTYNTNKRALWALTQRKVPLILVGRKVQLTPEGVEMWEAMQEWRPDLFTR